MFKACMLTLAFALGAGAAHAQVVETIAHADLLSTRGTGASANNWTVSGDTIVHKQSGVSCPASVAGLKRTFVHNFKADGSDVGCNYGETVKERSLQIYVTKSTADAALAAAGQGITVRFKNAAPATFSAPADGAKTGSFKFPDNGGKSELRASIAVAEKNGWAVQVRELSPEADVAKVEADVLAALKARVGEVK